MPKITALIPAYNEEKNIREVIRRLKRTLKAKIIVINDGSTDKTAKIASSMNVQVISHKINKGKGDALKTGFNYIKKSKADFVVIIDSDLQFYPEEAPKLLKPLIEKKADFVMGSRDWKRIPLRNRLGNFVWRSLFNLLFGTKLKDTNSGFIALTRKALENLKNAGGGYIIENYMIIQLIKNNFKVVNVPVKVEYKHKPGLVSGTRVVIGILIFIIKESIKYRLEKE